MRNSIILLILSTGLFFVNSCKTEDINPSRITSEIVITNSSAYWNKWSQQFEISSKIYLTGITPMRNKYVGHCWNFDTDTLPTIKSKSDIRAFDFLYDDLAKMYNHYYHFHSDIPVPEKVNKIIVRCFLLFNDTLVRYSDPRVLYVTR